MASKAVIVSLGTLGLAAAAWVGGSVVVGQRAEAALQGLKNAPLGQGGGLRIIKLTHERGLVGSKGQAEVAFEPGCAAEPGADQAITVRLDYTMSHLILPGRLTRFEWQATPLGASADEFKALFGSVTPLSGTGEVGMAGALRTEMGLPELSVQRSGEAIRIAPSKGFLTVDGDALAFGWKVDRVVTRGGGMAMEAKDIVVDVDLKNRHLGTGTAKFAAEHVSLGVGTLEGVALRSEASERGDRLDMTVTPSIRRLKANGVDLSDLSLEMALKGLDTRSVETLSKVFEASCGMKSLTAEEGRKARDAAVTLLARGLTVGIPKVGGKGADGAIDGRLLVELAPAKDGRPSLAAQLKSSGQLEISGTIIPADRRDMAVAMGFAVAQGTGLRAAFDYADGLLKVNDRSHDAGAMLTGLKAADAQMHTLLAAWGQPQPLLAKAPAEAPAEVLPEPAPVPAPAAEAPPVQAPAVAPEPAAVAPAAPAPTSAAECPALATCVQQTLAAARRADVDAVRRAAGAIDALAKPDLGNRPVSRQLNAAGLEALKRDDPAEAVARLRQALKENPRDVEVAGNLGFALVKAGQAGEAVEVLQSALVLDPRRTSTWTPLAEAYALAGRADDAKAALWVSFQWSSNRDKSLAYYQDRVANETRAPLRALYGHMAGIAQQQIASAQ